MTPFSRNTHLAAALNEIPYFAAEHARVQKREPNVSWELQSTGAGVAGRAGQVPGRVTLRLGHCPADSRSPATTTWPMPPLPL